MNPNIGLICRLAEPEDIPEITSLYQRVISDMDDAGIGIWDEVYPFCMFQEDIERHQLFVLLSSGQIAAAFSLCTSTEGEDTGKWDVPAFRYLYLDRLAVNPIMKGKGVGSAAVIYAEEQAKKLGADVIRLFVVDYNTPAVSLYRKSGFSQASGRYSLKIDDSLTMNMIPMEKSL